MGKGQTCLRHFQPQHLYRAVSQVPSPSTCAPLTRLQETSSREWRELLLQLPFPLGLVYCLNLSAFSFQPLVPVIQWD